LSSKDLRSKKIRAFILLTMRPGTSEEIVQSRKIKGVMLANSVLGRFDAIAVVEANSSEELTKIIYEMIEKHPNVVHTETMLSMFTPQT
jgi:DNA-binding Lrp family transcriptional regulator